MKTVVLMSTYNGERFIREQLDSILAQDWDGELQVLIRDDGSSDSTPAIVEQYCAAHSNISWYRGPNLGPARSFLDLLKNAPEADFYAFSDQDDVWLPDKISTGVKAIQGKGDGRPSLYFCQTQLVDGSLSPLDTHRISPLCSFGESLVYEFIGGCTMILSSALREAVNIYSPLYLTMHDVWVYKIALALGATVVFDPVPHILYRQHGDNAVGQGHSRTKQLKIRLNRLLRNPASRSKTAIELHKGFASQMNGEKLELLEEFVQAKKSIAARLRLFRDKRFHCSNEGIYRNFRIEVLLNIY